MTIDITPEAVAKMLDRMTFEAVYGEIDNAFASAIGMLLKSLAAERDGYRKLALAGELTARHVDILTAERDTLRVQLDATLKDRALIIAERDALSARVAELEAVVNTLASAGNAVQDTSEMWANRAEAAEAKLAEREAQVDRLLEAQDDQDQKLKDAEAENERLRGVLAVLAGDTEHAGFNPPAPTRTAKIARAALQETIHE
jgi:hypothetical protein